MNAAISHALDRSTPARAEADRGTAELGWGRLFHFLELALAHPGEEGFDYFRREETEVELLAALRRLPRADELVAQAVPALTAFLAALRGRSFDRVEAEHIALFSANFPAVPCPPYGSLFTVEENKRLDEMLAIKEFYHRSGVDISTSYDDLPDHLCVELEFLQLLCFRLNEALARGDDSVAADLRRTQAEFLDRFLLPFAERLAQVAARIAPDNPYAQLLVAARILIAHRRGELDARADP